MGNVDGIISFIQGNYGWVWLALIAAGISAVIIGKVTADRRLRKYPRMPVDR
jgi:hypothetical protein